MPQNIDQLKQKYQSAISFAQTTGNLQNVNMEGDKLFVRAEVANQDVKNKIWDEIKKVDPQYSDLTADITINSSLQAPIASTVGSNGSERKYTVKPGDSLSVIAERFYGKASEYSRIFEANKGQLSDPDKVRAGQELVIPA